MYIKNAYHHICQHLQSIANSPDVEARWILEHIFDTAYVNLGAQEKFSNAQRIKLDTILERRSEHEPLQYILGYGYFYGLKLEVTPDTLIPRPETEVLVHTALAYITNVDAPTIIDIGTGSGAIACAIKAECSKAEVWASDISQKALTVAQRNAAKLELDINFRHSDLLRNMSEISPDIILANLPYLPRADINDISLEVQQEPASALFSGDDGLDLYRNLLQQLDRNCTYILLELDPRNVKKAAQLAKALGYHTDINSDLVGRDRFLRLTRA